MFLFWIWSVVAGADDPRAGVILLPTYLFGLAILLLSVTAKATASSVAAFRSRTSAADHGTNLPSTYQLASPNKVPRPQRRKLFPRSQRLKVLLHLAPFFVTSRLCDADALTQHKSNQAIRVVVKHIAAAVHRMPRSPAGIVCARMNEYKRTTRPAHWAHHALSFMRLLEILHSWRATCGQGAPLDIGRISAPEN